MKPLKKENIDQALVRLRERYSLENLRKRPNFAKLTADKHRDLLIFVETVSLLLLDSYIRSNKQDP